MSTEIEVEEVRRAVLTQIVWHRHERQRWVALMDDEAESFQVVLRARAQAKGHAMVIATLRDVLDDVRVAARAKDRAFSGYLEVFGAAG